MYGRCWLRCIGQAKIKTFWTSLEERGTENFQQSKLQLECRERHMSRLTPRWAPGSGPCQKLVIPTVIGAASRKFSALSTPFGSSLVWRSSARHSRLLFSQHSRGIMISHPTLIGRSGLGLAIKPEPYMVPFFGPIICHHTLSKAASQLELEGHCNCTAGPSPGPSF